MLIITLQARLDASKISTEDRVRLNAALERISRAIRNKKINKASLARVINAFAQELNQAITKWQKLNELTRTYQSKINQAMSTINRKLISSSGITAEFHRYILRLKAMIRQAFNRMASALQATYSEQEVYANLKQLDAQLAKIK